MEEIKKQLNDYLNSNGVISNCLAYALRFWEQNPEYKLYYGNGHVINSRVRIKGEGILRAEDYGFCYFSSAFEGLLDEYEQKLLNLYFNQ